MTPQQKYKRILKLYRETRSKIEEYEGKNNPIDSDMIRSIQAHFFWDVSEIISKGKGDESQNGT